METESEPELLGWVDNEVKRDLSINNSQSHCLDRNNEMAYTHIEYTRTYDFLSWI
jgi:hypothetical protein